MEATALQVIEPQERQLTAVEMKSRVNLIQEVMHAVMKEGTHYDVLPGTNKPTLLKAGAEVINVTFRLSPRFVTKRENLPNGHREYEVTTALVHIPTGQVVSEGMGSCSTLESKYRYRYASRVCPTCDKDAIARSKAEYGGGWYCNRGKGGCGAKFAEDAPEIVNQEAGRVENTDIADCYNTVLKMAIKRSLVAATFNATAASDIFSQSENDEEEDAPQQRQAQKPQQQPKGKPPGDTPINQGQIGFLMQTCKECNVPEEVLIDYLKGKGITSRKDIKQGQLNEIIEWVKANKKEAS